MNITTVSAVSFAAILLCLSCSNDSRTTEDQQEAQVPSPKTGAVTYVDMADPVQDAGQFFLPLNTLEPKGYWIVTHTDYANRENPAKCSKTGDGLQGYLLMHSVTGLINKAAMDGKSENVAWMEQGGL